MEKKLIHSQNGILLSHKKDEILTFATTWMNWRLLCEISQA
jgi:hypothetical protein